MRTTFLMHGHGVVSKLFLAEAMSDLDAKAQAGQDAGREFGVVAGLNFFFSAKVERKKAFWEVTGSVLGHAV